MVKVFPISAISEKKDGETINSDEKVNRSPKIKKQNAFKQRYKMAVKQLKKDVEEIGKQYAYDCLNCTCIMTYCCCMFR